MIPWVRILLYFSIFSFIIVKLKNKSTPLSAIEITTAFACKIILGCLYGYIHLQYYNGDDTWIYNREAFVLYEQLKTSPLQFFRGLWPSYLENWPLVKDFISNNLEQEIMYRLVALCNLLTGGNYYLNVVVFNFILFWGHYWLFKLLVTRYPSKRLLLMLVIFFAAPIIFWLSGIRGDGLVFFFLSLTLLKFERWLSTKAPGQLVYCFLSMLGVSIFRSPVLLVLIPFLAGWFISAWFNKKPLVVYGLVYLSCCLVFFGSLLFHPVKNLPMIVAAKQQDFMQLPGKTRFDMEPLQPNILSYIKAAPVAFLNTLVRPFFWEARGLLQLTTAIETTLYLVLIVILMFFVRWKELAQDPFNVGIVLFSLSLFLFIGLTIPFPGAIVRYKAIPELLLLVGIVIPTHHIKRK